MESRSGRLDVSLMKDPISAEKYNEIHDFIHSDVTKIDIGNGEKVNLLTFKNQILKKIAHLPQEDQDKILEFEKEVKDKIREMARLKKKAFKLAGSTAITNNQKSISEQAKSKIFELYGRLNSDEEVQKKLADSGIPLSITAVRRFKQKYKDDIEKLQHEYEMDWRSVAITRKRSRLDQLSYIYNVLKQDFDNTRDIKKLNYSKEMRGVLEQVKKEVEGDVIKLNINGDINLTATIEMNKTVEELYSSINFLSLLIARVASRFQLNPLVLHYQLTNSWYSEFTGFKRNDKYQELTPRYPSTIVYNWDTIRDNYESKLETYERKANSLDIEDAIIVEDMQEKKKTMKELIFEKMRSLDNKRERIE